MDTTRQVSQAAKRQEAMANVVALQAMATQRKNDLSKEKRDLMSLDHGLPQQTNGIQGKPLNGICMCQHYVQQNMMPLPQQMPMTETSSIMMPPAQQTDYAIVETDPTLDVVANEVFGANWKSAVMKLWQFEHEFYSSEPGSRKEIMRRFVTEGFHSSQC